MATPILVNGRCTSLMLSCAYKMVNAALTRRSSAQGAFERRGAALFHGESARVGAPSRKRRARESAPSSARTRASRRVCVSRSFSTRPIASCASTEPDGSASERELTPGSRLQGRDRASFGSPLRRLSRRLAPRSAAAIRSSPRTSAPKRSAISPASEATELWRMNSARSANSRLSSVLSRRSRPAESAVGRASSVCMVGVR
jgi:hypothetical protein